MNVDGWDGQFTARASDGDAEHARGPDGELLDYPAMGRPLFLTGTFNKILSYQSGIYADQHYRFHEALMNADALVVIGYGFRDKAINSRIVAWAERPGERRMIVVHPRPGRVRPDRTRRDPEQLDAVAESRAPCFRARVPHAGDDLGVNAGRASAGRATVPVIEKFAELHMPLGVQPADRRTR